MKKIFLLSLFTSILLTGVVFLIYPLLQEAIVKWYLSLLKTTQVIQTSPAERFLIVLKTSLVTGAIPLLSFLVLLLLEKLKNRPLTQKGYLYTTILLLLAYVAGFSVKILLYGWGFKIADDPTAPGIINTIALSQLYFYNWGFILALLTAVLLVMVKRKQIAD